MKIIQHDERVSILPFGGENGITVYHPYKKKDKAYQATIAWGSWSDITVEKAESFFFGLQKAIDVAIELNNKFLKDNNLSNFPEQEKLSWIKLLLP